MSIDKFIFLLFLGMLANGCSVSPNKPAKQPMPAASSSMSFPQHETPDELAEKNKPQASAEVIMPNVLKPTARQRMSPVIQKMLARVDGLFDKKNYSDATSLLERALRIDPKNPLLWHKLARVKLTEGNYAQARQMANRSNQYVQNNVQLREKNQSIIDQAMMLSSEG